MQQTALDLLGRGYDVHVIADGVSSRTQVDRIFAIEVTIYGIATYPVYLYSETLL